MLNHWLKFAEFLNSRITLKNKNIFGGSNDGYLMSILKSKGANVLGIDASQFMVNLSKKKN